MGARKATWAGATIDSLERLVSMLSPSQWSAVCTTWSTLMGDGSLDGIRWVISRSFSDQVCVTCARARSELKENSAWPPFCIVPCVPSQRAIACVLSPQFLSTNRMRAFACSARHVNWLDALVLIVVTTLQRAGTGAALSVGHASARTA